MKLLRLAAVAAVLSLAACTSSPTDSARAGAPSFNGGGGLGSASFSDEGFSDTGTMPADTTVGRGPGMLGSGN